MIWKDIQGYEGLYMISDCGQVKSMRRPVDCSYRPERVLKERILINSIGTTGYYMVNLYKNKQCKYTRVHRLVAHAFLPRQKNKNIVNHKNGIRTDNRVDNLEWCTSAENVHHAVIMGSMLKKLNNIQRQIVVEAVGFGFKQADIAKYFNVNPSTIFRINQKLGKSK